MKRLGLPPKQGLYDPNFEHDSCGIGVIVNIKGNRSHKIIRQALEILKNLAHRGACGCEANTGDGAGILLQKPHKFFLNVCPEIGIDLPDYDDYGVGMIYLSPNAAEAAHQKEIFIKIVEEEGQGVLGWRDVPTDNSSLGETARSFEPGVVQVFIKRGEDTPSGMDFERKLYIIRKLVENQIRFADIKGGEFFYVTSLSHKTVVYKGMLTTWQLELYYPDLSDKSFDSALALIHSRFSTNTFPSWDRAHPYHYVIHNGEINTLRGNINWMHSRQAVLESSLYGKDMEKIFPIITPGGSDSAGFDNALEFLTLSGYSIEHAVMMMIPEPWSKHESMPENKKSFYNYHSCLMEPWDGPASIVFTDGEKVGAVLDRNGLRPSRYYITKDDLLILASEVGVLEIPPDIVEYKGRLQPGRMLLIDTVEGRIVDDEELKNRLSNERPYGDWLKENLTNINNIKNEEIDDRTVQDQKTVLTNQRLFGYTFEDLRVLIGPMAKDAVEPVGSMGVDTPIAVLSDKPKLLYYYFKQLFAQVTNPAIDAIREELITGTKVTLGPVRNILDPKPESCRKIELESPILTNNDLNKLKKLESPDFKSKVFPIHFNPESGGNGLSEAMDSLFEEVDKAITGGVNIVILSDREFNESKAPIPALLAVSGLHHHLIRNGNRMKIGLVLESGEPREVHHFALLIGYGVSAVNPYLAYDTIINMIDEDMLTDIDKDTAISNYVKSLVKGVVKTMSKMGISTVQSYHGAQIFEALGLGQDFIDNYFTWTPSRIGGAGIDVIAEEAVRRHKKAYPAREVEEDTLDEGGVYQWRPSGEGHMWNPQTVHKLQYAARTNSYELYKEFSELSNNEDKEHFTLRGLLDFTAAFGFWV